MKRILVHAMLIGGLAAPALANVAGPVTQGNGPNAASTPASDSGPVSAAAASAAASAHAASKANASVSSRNINVNRASGGSASVTNTVGNGGGNGQGMVGMMSPASLSTANTCAAGLSIAGFGSVGGGGGAAQWEMHDCRLRATAVLLDLRGDHDAAKGVWCQISEVRDAYALTDAPCVDHRPSPVIVPAPHRIAFTDRYQPDYCMTRDAGDKNQHLECDRGRTVR